MSLEPLELSEGVLLALPPIALAAFLHWVCIPGHLRFLHPCSQLRFQSQRRLRKDASRTGGDEHLLCLA